MCEHGGVANGRHKTLIFTIITLETDCCLRGRSSDNCGRRVCTLWSPFANLLRFDSLASTYNEKKFIKVLNFMHMDLRLVEGLLEIYENLKNRKNFRCSMPLRWQGTDRNLLLPSISQFIIFNNQLLGMIVGFSYLCFVFLGTWLFSNKQPMGYGDLLLILILDYLIISILVIRHLLLLLFF